MRRWGVVGFAVLIALAAGCARSAPAVVEVASSPAPTPSSTPTRTQTVTPRATPTGTSKPAVIDLSGRVTKNKLYAAGKLPVVACKLPVTALRSTSQMLRYARVMVDCMQRAWAPLIAKSDSFYGSAQVAAFTVGKGVDPPLCADPPKNADAFYRYQGNVICLDRSVFTADDPVANLVDFQQLLAHEFGHHVQMSVGILTAYNLNAFGTTAQQLEDERRKELQASCFGAAFLGANKQTFKLTGYRQEIWRDIVRHIGDEYNPDHIRDHGSRKNHGYWTLRAFDSGNPASCNTFTAPAKRVS